VEEMSNPYEGELVRLAAADPEPTGEHFAKWSRDSEFFQLFDTDPPMIRDGKKAQEYFRKQAEKENPGSYGFLIQRLDDDRIIGMTALFDANSQHRNAWVAIGIGERELWGKGYGTDAMNLILRYGFMELNLHRVNLYTFDINPRAIRSYEKSGFVHEGKVRLAMNRYGKRADLVYMGILRREWQERQN
jgi:RimJ/RimL family protein N-acetyltransferase